MQAKSKYSQLTLSGIYIALYLVIMVCTQSFAFGQYQVRIATALYGLSALFPFLIIPSCIANILSNTLMGGLGIMDIVGGGLVGLLTTSLIVFGKKQGWGNWIVFLAVTFIPGLCVPMWLSALLNIPYWVLASNVLVGQAISGFASYMLVGALEKVGVGSSMIMKSF